MSPFGGLTDNKESSGSCLCEALSDPVVNHSGQTALPNVKGRFLTEHTHTHTHTQHMTHMLDAASHTFLSRCIKATLRSMEQTFYIHTIYTLRR